MIRLGHITSTSHILGGTTNCKYIGWLFLLAPLCSVPKWKKANEPTRGAFRWRISWKSKSGLLHSIFFILVLKGGGVQLKRSSSSSPPRRPSSACSLPHCSLCNQRLPASYPPDIFFIHVTYLFIHLIYLFVYLRYWSMKKKHIDPSWKCRWWLYIFPQW